MVLIPFVLSTFVSAICQGTTFLERPFPESVSRAPTIVRGKAASSRADWAESRDGMRRIYTYTELEVIETLKGEDLGSKIVARELGGAVAGVALEVPGTAKFEPGEEVIVFLSGQLNSDGSLDLKGMMMGKFEIKADADGQEWITGPGISSSGHEHLRQGGQKWTISALRKLIKEQKGSDLKGISEDQTKSQTPAPRLQPSGSQALPGKGGAVAPEEGDRHEENSKYPVLWLALAGLALLALGVLGFRSRLSS